ncbi:MAG: CPBP family intramembrane metalloprotease [Nitrospirae bacterium]|nr:CPBP family intramembrane metalloprotease [Nitrospirota bacterium]
MNSDKNRFVLYMAVFFVVWSVRTVFLIPYVAKTFAEPVIVESIRNLTKIFIWIAPLYLYLKFFERISPYYYLKIDDRILRGIGLGIAAGIAFFAFRFMAGIFSGSDQLFKTPFIGDIVGGVIFAGIIEEPFFRGFVLQKLQGFASFWKANFIASFLFALSHMPSWIYHGDNNIFADGLNVLVFGLFLGWLFKRTGSLWSAIVFHSAYNLATLVITGNCHNPRLN